MAAFLLYLIKSGTCLILFYVCFKALFSNDTFFRFNRWLLLTGTFICLLLPAIPVKTARITRIQQPFVRLESLINENHSLTVPADSEIKNVIPTETNRPNRPFPWIGIAGVFYLSGCIICLGTVILSFHRMSKLIGSGKKVKQGKYILILTPGPIPPFSWGHYIILSEEDYMNHPEEILTHEKMHIRYHHSSDLIFIETVLVFQWFNPATWLLKRELRDIHEYQADKGVLNQGIDATKYQLLLVKKAVGSSLYTLANSFNHSKIKKRITMMLKKKSNGWARLKLLLLVPVGLTALNVFARPEIDPVTTEASSPVLPAKKADTNSELTSPGKNTINPEIAQKKDKRMCVYLIQNGKIQAVVPAGSETPNLKLSNFSKDVITIQPDDKNVSLSFMEKIKTEIEKAGFTCKIKTEAFKIGEALPPPPPPAPDGLISFSYKSGKESKGFFFYERHLKPGIGLEQNIDKIYGDDIETVTITIYPKAPEGLLEGVQKILKDKIKYEVKYEVKKE